ncbi:SDC3 protein, partial [Dasyornis broadbenti]|nr:SDC3 protein [Dasyornis broadbenti]
AQRWRNENYERPVDLEGSGDDDPFGEDELDDIYSGSGSGYFESELGLDTAVSPTTATLVPLPSTVAALPATVQPMATPLGPSPTPQDTTPVLVTSAWATPRATEAPAMPSWTDTTTEATTTTTSSSTTVATAKPTTIRRFLPPLATKAATTRATTTPEPPSTALPEASAEVTEVATSRPVPSSTARPRALPKPSTSRTAEPPEESTALPPAAATLPPTEVPQMEPGEVTTALDKELEVPASSGPSGDFEIREEEETPRPELGNEVLAVATVPAGPGPGRNVETGLVDNTIDSGNSAAQLPQKNILERKEVLI